MPLFQKLLKTLTSDALLETEGAAFLPCSLWMSVGSGCPLHAPPHPRCLKTAQPSSNLIFMTKLALTLRDLGLC